MFSLTKCIYTNLGTIHILRTYVCRSWMRVCKIEYFCVVERFGKFMVPGTLFRRAHTKMVIKLKIVLLSHNIGRYLEWMIVTDFYTPKTIYYTFLKNSQYKIIRLYSGLFLFWYVSVFRWFFSINNIKYYEIIYKL